MEKKRRRRIRKGRVALLLLFLAAVITVIYYIIVALVAFFSWLSADEPVQEEKPTLHVTPEMLACDERMQHRLDSLMHKPLRLDTNKIAVSVFDATTQRYVYRYHDTESFIPASCMKISTAIAALKTLGMNHQYREHILAMGEMKLSLIHI